MIFVSFLQVVNVQDLLLASANIVFFILYLDLIACNHQIRLLHLCVASPCSTEHASMDLKLRAFKVGGGLKKYLLLWV